MPIILATFVPRDTLKLAATYEVPEWGDPKLGAQFRYQSAIRASDDTGSGIPILRVIEDKRLLPVGADKEVGSDFQLIAGTNRDLAACVAAGTFRDDLYARLNLWTFTLPGLTERREDIAPNLDYELDRHAEREGDRVTFNREARERYLSFATSTEARWHGNFRDLAASVTRLATFSPRGANRPRLRGRGDRAAEAALDSARRACRR